jgi:hypothetical protein
MLRPPSEANAVPRWLVIVGSAAAVAHLGAVIVTVLAVSSGPWPTPEGSATPPQFAYSLHGLTAPYLRAVKLERTYHFYTNRPGVPDAAVEVRLKDDKGEPIQTVRFPDPGANRFVRHRQQILARQLADDQPVPPPQGEVIPAPSQEVRHVTILDGDGGRNLTLRSVPEHLVPRDRPVFTPSEWSLVLARSYTRYLCRTHGAASGEVIRHFREAIPPVVLFNELPAANFEETITHFGEMPR